MAAAPQDGPLRSLELPSLEWLQRANSHAILLAVFMLGIGIVSGMILNSIRHAEPAGGCPGAIRSCLGTLGMFAWLLAAVVVGHLHRPPGRAAGRLPDRRQLRRPGDRVGIGAVAGHAAWGKGRKAEGGRRKGALSRRCRGRCGESCPHCRPLALDYPSIGHPPSAFLLPPSAFRLPPSALP